jgi:hypothetical protein
LLLRSPHHVVQLIQQEAAVIRRNVCGSLCFSIFLPLRLVHLLQQSTEEAMLTLDLLPVLRLLLPYLAAAAAVLAAPTHAVQTSEGIAVQ